MHARVVLFGDNVVGLIEEGLSVLMYTKLVYDVGPIEAKFGQQRRTSGLVSARSAHVGDFTISSS